MNGRLRPSLEISGCRFSSNMVKSQPFIALRRMMFRKPQIIAASVAFVFALQTAGAASMYAMRGVRVAEDGASVTLARRGAQVPLPELAASAWCAESFSGRAKISFGEDAFGRFLALDGPGKPGDTAWEVRSPRVQRMGAGGAIRSNASAWSLQNDQCVEMRIGLMS